MSVEPCIPLSFEQPVRSASSVDPKVGISPRSVLLESTYTLESQRVNPGQPVRPVRLSRPFFLSRFADRYPNSAKSARRQIAPLSRPPGSSRQGSSGCRFAGLVIRWDSVKRAAQLMKGRQNRIPLWPEGYFAGCYSKAEAQEENRLAKASVIRAPVDLDGSISYLKRNSKKDGT